MNKIIELRKMIQAFLVSIHPRVYYERAPDNAIYPYVVYDLPNSDDDGSTENFILDVDGWDAPEDADTTVLETLMGNIDGDGDRFNPTGLHRKTMLILTGQLSATFYRENRLTLTDDDKRIRRRKYVYQVRTHEGG